MYEQRLADEHGFAQPEINQIRESAQTYVDECAERALASPMPDPALATAGVFAESWEALGDGEAPWSRWSAPEGADAPGGNGRATTNGNRGELAEHGRTA
jgi:hypothetical protein